MTVFVDELRTYHVVGKAARYGTEWCHMFTDGDTNELHTMALKIQLPIRHFQDKDNFPHYDLTPNKRKQAIQAGAIEIRLVDFIRSKRHAKSNG
jgi:hypothetical protein